MFYLGYLRRQTRIEERVRRRRMQRMARCAARCGEHRRPRVRRGARRGCGVPERVVLEIDDEDPIFEHLDYAPVRPGVCGLAASGGPVAGSAACRRRLVAC